MYQIPKTICFIFIPIHSFYSGTLIIYFIPIHSFYSGTSSDEEEKENAKVIEIIIDKDFILWKNRLADPGRKQESRQVLQLHQAIISVSR
jgi:hypothetical protein